MIDFIMIRDVYLQIFDSTVGCRMASTSEILVVLNSVVVVPFLCNFDIISIRRETEEMVSHVYIYRHLTKFIWQEDNSYHFLVDENTIGQGNLAPVYHAITLYC